MSAEVARELANTRLVEAIEALPAALRLVFVLRYVQKMPRKEIASRLRISVEEVEDRLTRALVMCRKRMGDEVG